MKPIIAIDPGTYESAFVVWTGAAIVRCGIVSNQELLEMLMTLRGCYDMHIEMIGHYGTGMPAGKEVFDTCVWIGRFIQAYGAHTLVMRREVKHHFCGNAKAKDGNIRQALIDRFGPPGVKKQPGITYGLKSHLWQAFALAVFAHDTRISL